MFFLHIFFQKFPKMEKCGLWNSITRIQGSRHLSFRPFFMCSSCNFRYPEFFVETTHSKLLLKDSCFRIKKCSFQTNDISTTLKICYCVFFTLPPLPSQKPRSKLRFKFFFPKTEDTRDEHIVVKKWKEEKKKSQVYLIRIAKFYLFFLSFLDLILIRFSNCGKYLLYLCT